MNILFLNSIERGVYGGMEEWIRLVSSGLADRGHSVNVVGRKGSKFLERLKLQAQNINIIPLEISGDFHPSTISKLKKLIKSLNIDIVTCNFNKDIRLGGLASRWAGEIKVVWSVGLDITKDRFIHKKLTPKLIDGVITPSEALKKQITRIGYIDPEIVSVIPISIPGVDLDKSESRDKIIKKYKLSPENLIAVTAGRLVNQKGHIFLVKAAEKIVEKIPHIKFLLLGDGPLEEQLRAEIGKRKLTDYFVFAGMLADLNTELSGADIMIHPSIDEPYGIVILEGMRAGLPVVASRVGGIPEVVEEGQTAMLFEPENYDDLNLVVTGVSSNINTLQDMGRLGYERWQKYFDYPIMINKIESYFSALVT